LAANLFLAKASICPDFRGKPGFSPARRAMAQRPLSWDSVSIDSVGVAAMK